MRPFTGDSEPLGSGMFAGTVRSSFSCALSYCGLISLECDPLVEGFNRVLSFGYGWCRYQPPGELCCLHAGGDHGSSESGSPSDSELSDLNPEC